MCQCKSTVTIQQEAKAPKVCEKKSGNAVGGAVVCGVIGTLLGGPVGGVIGTVLGAGLGATADDAEYKKCKTG